jgi:hypothetical protein
MEDESYEWRSSIWRAWRLGRAGLEVNDVDGAPVLLQVLGDDATVAVFGSVFAAEQAGVGE